MYFFEVKNDSTTPCTAELRGMLPGTCAMTSREYPILGWRWLNLTSLFAICFGVVMPTSAIKLRCMAFG